MLVSWSWSERASEKKTKDRNEQDKRMKVKIKMEPNRDIIRQTTAYFPRSMIDRTIFYFVYSFAFDLFKIRFIIIAANLS